MTVEAAPADRVGDAEVLYRRVPTGQNYYRLVGGVLRVSSQAFADRHRAPSVDRAVLCGHDPHWAQESADDGVVSVVASDVRAIDLPQRDLKGNVEFRYGIDVHPDPIAASAERRANPAHAEIRPSPEYRTDSVFKRLLEALARLAGDRPWDVRPVDHRD